MDLYLTVFESIAIMSIFSHDRGWRVVQEEVRDGGGGQQQPAPRGDPHRRRHPCCCCRVIQYGDDGGQGRGLSEGERGMTV